LETLSRKLEGKWEAELKVGMTPMKKRPKLDVLTPVADAGFEVTLAVLENDIGESDRMVVSNLKFEGIDIHITKLLNLIGKRPEELGITSAFGYSIHLDNTLNDLRKEIEQYLWEAKRDEGVVAALKDEIYANVSDSFKPMFRLFSQLSSDKSKSGDKLMTELDGIRKEVQMVKHAQNGGSIPGAAPATTGLAWGLSATVAVPNNGHATSAQPTHQAGNLANGPHSANPGVTAMLKTLETRIDDIDQQLASAAVEVGGMIFRSKTETKAWLAANAGAPGAYIMFMDAHALLGVAFQELEVVSFEAGSLKAGYSSIEEAVTVTGFKIGLPHFFGKDPKSNVASNDTRVLQAIRTPEAWDSGNGFTGARRTFEQGVAEHTRAQSRSTDNVLTANRKIVANLCISASGKFLTDLGAWITREYEDLIKRGGSAKECWGLIAHCERAIFAELHSTRSPGRCPFLPGDRAARVVWGMLQAQRKMQAFTVPGFSAFPVLSHILNIHLRDHAVMQADFEEWKEKLARALKMAEAAKAAADRALTNANAKK
jgi:hypothetical protein